MGIFIYFLCFLSGDRKTCDEIGEYTTQTEEFNEQPKQSEFYLKIMNTLNTLQIWKCRFRHFWKHWWMHCNIKYTQIELISAETCNLYPEFVRRPKWIQISVFGFFFPWIAVKKNLHTEAAFLFTLCMNILTFKS